jgi:hypothetical protein
VIAIYKKLIFFVKLHAIVLLIQINIIQTQNSNKNTL